ncbi:MAG: CbiQ family ECF transporter T component [PVC group bacterium]
MLSQHVHHGKRHLVMGAAPLLARVPSFLAGRHPLLKLLIWGGVLGAFLLVPDRSPRAAAGKLAVLIILFFISGGRRRWKGLLRAFLLLAGFLSILFLCTILGDRVSGGSSMIFFRAMAFRSAGAVTISFLAAGSLDYRECVYLTRMLHLPPFFTSQVLLVVMIWGKLLEEFYQVPLAWESRGVTSRYVRRHPRILVDLLKVVLLRVTGRAGRLELALIGRGFSGRLYTCFSASWSLADTVTLLGFIGLLQGLAGVTGGKI